MSITLALSIVLSVTQQVPPPAEMLIRLNVRPKAAPKPALRYSLLPELTEMTHGNPVQGYLLCFFDQDLGGEQEVLGKNALRQADRAARMDSPDWQIVPKLKTEGFGTLIPEVQKIRALIGALQGRLRSEIAQGRMDDAIVTVKTMLAMTRHMKEHPTLIGQLVGFALATITLSTLEEMIAHPDCPNLYWALTSLPHPLIPLEKGMDGERITIDAELRDLRDSKPMTPAELKKLIQYIDRIRDLETSSKEKRTRDWLDEKIKLPDYIAAARRRLIDYGIANEILDHFPAEQVVLLDEKRELEVRRDEVTKLIPLPTWKFLEMFAALKLPPRAQDPTLFGSSLLSAYEKIRMAQGRVEQRIALIRVVEAIRLHAADHGGKLPATLSDITVPLPVDPFTGKPFRYELAGATAHLRGTPPASQAHIAAYNLHYEIAIK